MSNKWFFPMVEDAPNEEKKSVWKNFAPTQKNTVKVLWITFSGWTATEPDSLRNWITWKTSVGLVGAKGVFKCGCANIFDITKFPLGISHISKPSTFQIFQKQIFFSFLKTSEKREENWKTSNNKSGQKGKKPPFVNEMRKRQVLFEQCEHKTSELATGPVRWSPQVKRL